MHVGGWVEVRLLADLTSPSLHMYTYYTHNMPLLGPTTG